MNGVIGKNKLTKLVAALFFSPSQLRDSTNFASLASDVAM